MKAFFLRRLLLLAPGLLLLPALACGRELPSDAELAAAYPARRAALDSLRMMSDADPHVIRIAPTFTRLDTNWAWPRPVSLLGMSRARWDTYRRLFKRVGAESGLERSEGGEVWIVVRSVGLQSSGASRGYLFLPHRPRLARKSLDVEPQGIGTSRRELSDGWYLFDRRD